MRNNQVTKNISKKLSFNSHIIYTNITKMPLHWKYIVKTTVCFGILIS